MSSEHIVGAPDSAKTMDAAGAIRAVLQRRIPHSHFKPHADQVKKLFDRRDLGLSAKGHIVYGPTGCGKTTMLEHLYEYGVERHGPDSCLKLRLSGSTTFAHVTSAILDAMGDPCAGSSTTSMRLTRLIKGLISRKTRVILVDEFQHIIHGSLSHQRMMDVSNAFKSIIDQADTSFVLFGMSSIRDLELADPQLRRRLLNSIEMSYFHFPRDVSDWLGLCEEINLTIQQYGFHFAGAAGRQPLYLRLLAASKGSLAQLVTIISEAIVFADSCGSPLLSKEMLQRAISNSINSSDGMVDALDAQEERVKKYLTDMHKEHRERSLESVLGV